jgi:hypothetical protein
MSKQRLNLTVEPSVIERARRYTERHNTSISKLVTAFLSQLPDAREPDELPPTVKRLLGVAKGGPDREEYRDHLVDKYDR